MPGRNPKTLSEQFREKLERRLIEFRKMNPRASFEAVKKEAIDFAVEEHEAQGRQVEQTRERARKIIGRRPHRRPQ